MPAPRGGARETAKPGEWILGHGWNQNTWGNWPIASELDSIAPNNPVYLTAKSLHAGWVNTNALKSCEHHRVNARPAQRTNSAR
ncbi:MAG: amidohydrolase family protein [Anaerolineales bacterium]